MIAAATPALRISALTHEYARGAGALRALDGVSIDAREGEFVCIVGPSGCGKSTLLRVAAGLIAPAAGEVRVGAGTPAEAQRAKRIGVVFQDPALLPWRTVEANVRLPAELGARGEAAADMLALVGLDEFARYYPRELSGGMAQRVALARALAGRPSLLLMDEPFGALDEITRDEMRYELLRVWQRARPTVLFVTHSVREAVALGDRVVVLSARPGRVVADVRIELPRPRDAAIEREPAFERCVEAVRSRLAPASLAGAR